MHKLLVICGPTATGKTSLGVLLAKKLKGEIVSADSRQVYIGMNLGTGKDIPKNSKFEIFNFKPVSQRGESIPNKKYQIGYRLIDGVKVWLLDAAKPNQEFSAAGYANLASKVIDDICQRNKLPIIVGGTGFYVKALIDGIGTFGVPPDWQLRRDLEKLSREKLFEMLSRLDSEKAASMNVSDRKNPRRLIRAIEIALVNQKSKIKNQNYNSKVKINTDLLFIGLSANYKFLYDRVDKRIEEQIEQGAEKEIKNLLTQGYTWDLPAMTAMGYRIWKPYFEKKKTRELVISEWKYSEHAYVRRQMTWFKKDKRINWFDITSKNWMEKVAEKVEYWYNQS